MLPGHTSKKRPAQHEQAFCMPLWLLFEFDRCGRFAGAVVEHAVDAFDFVDDAACGLLQDFPRQLGALGGHEVARHDGAQGDGVVVGAAVAMTPTLRMFVSAAKYWPRPSTPALATSSR